MFPRFMSEAGKDSSISASAVVFPKEADFAVPQQNHFWKAALGLGLGKL